MSEEAPHHYPMCVVCEDRGGFAIKPGGTWYPPQRACAPYDDHTWFTNAEGKRVAQAWPFDPMCPIHAHELTERVWKTSREKREHRSESGMVPATTTGGS